MRNKDVADFLQKMGTLLEIQGENIFKIKAYYKASENILALGEDIEEIKNRDGLGEIPGVGEAIRSKIKEFLETGRVEAYEKLTQEIPETVLDLTRIPSVGPKKAKLFFEKLKIKNVDDLYLAATTGKLLGVEGIKDKTIENIINGIKLFRAGQERMNLGDAWEIARVFVDLIEKDKGVKQTNVSGSLRRGCETIGDIDILVESDNPKSVMDTVVTAPFVSKINAHGETKSSIVTKDNVQVDVRVVPSDCYGAALLYFTGSKNFNVKLRQLAQQKNMKVNEYGVFKVKGEKETLVAAKTEEECFKSLGMSYIPPELREDIGEAALWSGAKIPELICPQDIRGDFHVHSTYSDGNNTMEEMARAAMQLGYKYLAISDHSPQLRVAGGVSIENLKKKRVEMDALNKKFKNFKLLMGTEVEIDSEGELDYNSDVLKSFDVVVASIHSGFNQTKEKLTRRLIKACQHPSVNIIGHPFGVHLGKRDAYDVDFEEVCRAAVDNNVFLEINACPIRLDLNSQHVYFARSKGVQFSINSDAHAIEQLQYMPLGVTIARRGWLTTDDVLNTCDLPAVLKKLKKK